MGRPIRMRQSYTGDRSALLKLEVAIERDERLERVMRTTLTEKIKELVQLLSDTDSVLLVASPKGSRSSRARRIKTREKVLVEPLL